MKSGNVGRFFSAIFFVDAIFLERVCAGGQDIPDYRCTDGWYNHLTRCYRFFDTELQSLTWYDARDTCLALGAALYVPTSAEEGEFIQATLVERGKFSLDAIWIGCNDESQEGTFVCTEDTGLNDYRNWNEGEPNDLLGEDCVAVYILASKNVTTWNDKMCSNMGTVNYHYVCERAGTNTYTRTRMLHVPSDRLSVSGQCLVEQPELLVTGTRTSSLIKCAARCSQDSQCESFNFQRRQESSSSSSTSGLCQTLSFSEENIPDNFVDTPIDNCNHYEFKDMK